MSKKLNLFTCDRHPGNLRLTPSACAKSYSRGKHSEVWDSAHHCRGCLTGADHAGENVPAVAEDRTCRLCGKKRGTKTVYGCVCISCYNRLAEAFKGRNAKGKSPQKMCGRQIGGLVIVARETIVFAGSGGRLAWMARAPGMLPVKQMSLFG